MARGQGCEPNAATAMSTPATWRFASVSALVLTCCMRSAGPTPLGYDVPVELTGRVVSQEQYGPPNYGENPETDAKVRILVLRLSAPIELRADTGNTANL